MFPFVLYYIQNNNLYVKIPYKFLTKYMYFLKYHTKTLYKQLVDISAVDSIDKKFRFEVFFQLLSMAYNQRLTVTTSVLENIPLESLTKLYPSAN